MQIQNQLRQNSKLSKAELDRQAAEALVSKHDCPKCWDTGWIDTNRETQAFGLRAWMELGVPASEIIWCDCKHGKSVRASYEQVYQDGAAERRQRRLTTLFERASVPARFKDFNLELPKELLNAKYRAYATCRMMIKEGVVVPSRLGEYDPIAVVRSHEKITHPDRAFKSLTLSGPKGAGKTVALSVAFRNFLEQGMDGLWIEWYDFVMQVQAGYSFGNGESSADKLIKAAQDASVLMLDDLGDLVKATARNKDKRKASDDKRRILWQVLGKRHSEDLATLVTTNLDDKQLYDHFDGRIIDRLMEMSFWCPMNGANLREM